jgi:hypothetical protein
MLANCQMLAWLRALAVAGTCFIASLPLACAETFPTRLEHLHHASTSIAHAMSTAQLLGHAMAKRAIGRPEEQFLRELNICQNLGGINFGEARWRLQAVDASSKLEELAHSERLFGIVLEAARQWNGTPEDAFNVLEALGVLNAQLERLSVGLGRMSDDELATLVQRTLIAAPAIPQSIPGPSTSDAPLRPRDDLIPAPIRPRNTAWRIDD